MTTVTGGLGVPDLAVLSLLCLGWDHHSLLGVSLEQHLAQQELSSALPAAVPSCPGAKGKVPSPLPVLPEAPGEEIGLCCCCGSADTLVPCQQGHTNPMRAGFVISTVTRGA